MKTTRHTRGGGSLFSLLIILAVVITVAVIVKPSNVCEKPLAYDIGVVDNEFGITSEKFGDVLAEAENIWEEGTGMNLFTYQPGADFKINLVFDERQRKTIAEQRAREALEMGGDSYDGLTKKYEVLLSTQKSKLSRYNRAVSSYENRLIGYNKKVAYYNNIGGAPKKEYGELRNERMQLESMLPGLKQQGNELDALNTKLNIIADEINKVAGTYNTEVAKYNRAYGTSVTFDQGEYTGNAINIYQFDKIPELRLVLGHEFGHSLNLEHLENPTSIMYYLMGEQSLKAPKLSEEDINALKTECGLK